MAWAPPERGAAPEGRALAVNRLPRLSGLLRGSCAHCRERLAGAPSSVHAGLQRDLARALGKPPGPFLRPWTEVVLDVSPPASPDGAADPAEPRPSGGHALHLYRAHLRLRGGGVEFVRPHWRGDPAHGVAQRTYRLAN